MTETIIKTEDLVKHYKDGYHDVSVLNHVNFTLNKGEFASIRGSSGAGKSTLLNMLGCLDIPTSGTIEINGSNITDIRQSKIHEFRMRNIGFVFQHHYLLPGFTVVENVMQPLMLLGYHKNEARAKSLELLGEIGLEDRTEHLPSEISGGESQRVAVARAMVARPSLFLVDEPTGNLDGENTSNFIRILTELQKNHQMSIMVVTHEVELADQADTKYIMKGGKLSLLE